MLDQFLLLHIDGKYRSVTAPLVLHGIKKKPQSVTYRYQFEVRKFFRCFLVKKKENRAFLTFLATSILHPGSTVYKRNQLGIGITRKLQSFAYYVLIAVRVFSMGFFRNKLEIRVIFLAVLTSMYNKTQIGCGQNFFFRKIVE